MEGRQSVETYRRLVASAAEAHFNGLRMWGGGTFLPDGFYDACDEAGLLVYHDMTFAQGNHGPSGSPTEEAEIRHQVRRLSAHPSIAVWDGCNEVRGDRPGAVMRGGGRRGGAFLGTGRRGWDRVWWQAVALVFAFSARYR